MKEKYLSILLLLCCFNISSWAEEKNYISVSPAKEISKMKKRKIKPSPLYSTENQANQYVQFLLDNKLLDSDNNGFYSISLIDKNTKWQVLLFASEKPEKDVIIYTLDAPLRYIFNLDKKSGQISDLYIILQQ